MSIQKKIAKDGTVKWEVRVRTNGRGSKRLSRVFEKKVEAYAYLHDFKVRAATIKKHSSGVNNFEETTFEKESRAWLEDAEVRFSASHIKRVTGILNEFLPKIGRLTPDKFTPSFLSSLQRQMKADGAKNLTVNRKTEVFTAILNFSVKQRRIPFNPASGFRKLPSDQKEMQFWDRREAESFLKYVNEKYFPESPERWIYVVYLLALNTGMRAGEIWGLQPRDMIDDTEVLFIRRQYDRVKKDFGQTKGKKPRHVPCQQDLTIELQTLVSKRKVRLDQAIFHGKEGLPINHDSFGDRRFDKDVREWGGRRIRFHDLRHTATTLMIGQGVDLKTVKEICGHKDISTTMNYAHLLGDNLKQVARTFSIMPSQQQCDFAVAEVKAGQRAFGRQNLRVVGS
jgi:integrase